MNYFGPPYSFSVGMNNYEKMTLERTIAVVRPHILGMKERIKAVHETYGFVYRTNRFKSELPEVNKFLDAGFKLIADYNLILEQLNKRDVRLALVCTTMLDKTYYRWAKELDTAVGQKTVNRVVNRLELIKDSLEFTRDGCIAIEATLFGAVIAGEGIAVIAARAFAQAGYQGVVSVAQQGMSISSDLQQEIDWKGLGTEFIFNSIFSAFGSVLRQKLVGKFLGTTRINQLLKTDLQLAEMLGITYRNGYLLMAPVARRLAEAIAHVVVNRTAGIIRDILKGVLLKTIEDLTNSNKVPRPNWDFVLDTIASEIEKLTWKNFFWDIVRSQLRVSGYLQNMPR